MKYLFKTRARWPQAVLLGLSLGLLGHSASAQQPAGCSFPPNVTPTPYNGIWTPPLGAAGYNPNVNYCVPNFSVSPPLRKFKDALPGLNAANKNGNGQYIPVAQPDTTTFAGSDYYEIGLRQYTEKMHSDLPGPTDGSNAYRSFGTKLRGYYQKKTAVMTGVDDTNHYLGPMIIAQRGRPVRFKFYNELALSNARESYLPLPVDYDLMGMGMGRLAPDGVTPCDPMVSTTCASYTENRAVIHLHGGLTPWISDGTPHQWITPAGDPTVYKKGDSFQNVPDMIGTGPGQFTPAINDGIGTYYYTNNQSGRLLFYHDHSLGLTRLNVYAGEAAPYLIVDPEEERLINAGVLPNLYVADKTPGASAASNVYRYGIPLVIQDKSFVNGDAAGRDHKGNLVGTGAQANGAPNPMPATKDADPLWYVNPNFAKWFGNTIWGSSQHGDLWLPHEYLPNEDPFNTWFDPATQTYGANPMGRWDYSPWMNPPAIPMIDVLPSPTVIPETYGDTMLVNGTAFPYLELPPAPARFRILNASNDRFINLQLYYASTPSGQLCKNGNVADLTQCTEVSMVPAINYKGFAGLTVSVGNLTVNTASFPDGSVAGMPTWPTDGRAGGVPYWEHSGPAIHQIGNEAGFLAQVATWPSQPIDFDHNTRSVTLNGVNTTSLLLPSAVRADAVVDFSGVPSGSALILYNDAPAPMPLWDNRNDYYTNDGDQSWGGGAPNTDPGFGPNTRTVMQFRINGTPSAPFNLAQLQTELPKAYFNSQHPPLVPQTYYPKDNTGAPYNVTNIFANVADESLNISGQPQTIARVVVTAPGMNYNQAPTVKFSGGSCKNTTTGLQAFPSATAQLNGVTGINLLTSGSGYTTPPTVTITPAAGGGGTGATAVATITGGMVTNIIMTNPGSGYLLAPTVTLSAPGGAGVAATATANVVAGSIGTVTLGANAANIKCLSAPLVSFIASKGNPGTGATAVTTLTGAIVLDGKNLVEGFDREYGRMDAMLGSTPNPLTPAAGAGAVVGVAYYVDPPTEVLTGGTTYLWRIMHIGVDSHAVHVHLFDAQLVNRVDWTGVISPPTPGELGWKDTIRTNPFEDIILALRPAATDMKLPFTLPNSLRLLDPTVPVGSTGIFTPVAPPPGVPALAQTTNVVSNYNWEYVWHCHLLGHEENDMMRPIVFIPEMPAGGLNPQSLSFTATAIGGTSASQTVTLTNSGVNTLTIAAIGFTANTGAGTDFQRAATPGTCAAGPLVSGASCTINVVFKPTTAGAVTGSLDITDDSMGIANNVQRVLLNGSGLAPIATVTPAALNFGTVNIGSVTTAQMVTVSNSGGSPLSITNVAMSSGEYALTTGAAACGTAYPVTVAAGSTCNLYVTLTAAASGTRSGTMTISSNSGTNTVSLTGVGANVPMATLSVQALDFGLNKKSVAATNQTITITNTGAVGSSLTMGTVTIINPSTAGVFSVVANTCTGALAKNATCSITLGFLSANTGSYTADVQIMSTSGIAGSTPSTTILVPLTSTVATPVAGLSSLVTTFGPATVGTAYSTAATLSNTGAVPLAISNVSFAAVSGNSAPYTQTNNCGASLLPNATCTITVTYTPAVYNAVADVVDLVVTDDDGGTAGTQQKVRYSGTTIAPAPVAGLTGSLAFGTGLTATGSSALKTATLTNSGNAPLNISSIAVTNTLGTNYSINSTTCLVAPATTGTLAAGASCTISVKFAPTKAKTVSSGTLTVTDNSANVAGTKQTLAITGTSK